MIQPDEGVTVLTDEQKEAFWSANKLLLQLRECLKQVLDQKLSFLIPVRLKIIGALDLLKRMSLGDDSHIDFTPKYFEYYAGLKEKLFDMDLRYRMPRRAKLVVQLSNLQEAAANAFKNKKRRKKHIEIVMKAINTFYEFCQSAEGEFSLEEMQKEFDDFVSQGPLFFELLEAFEISNADIKESFEEIEKTIAECKESVEIMTNTMELLDRVKQAIQECLDCQEAPAPPRSPSPFQKRQVSSETLHSPGRDTVNSRSRVIQSQLLDLLNRKESEIQDLKTHNSESQSPSLLESIIFHHEKDLRELAFDAARASQLQDKVERQKAKLKELSHLKEVLARLRTRGIETPDELLTLIDERDALRQRNEVYKARNAKLQEQNSYLRTSIHESMRSFQSAFRANIDQIESYLSDL